MRRLRVNKIKYEDMYLAALSLFLWRTRVFANLIWRGSFQILYRVSAVMKLAIIGLLCCLFFATAVRRMKRYHIIALAVMACAFLSYYVTREDTLIWTFSFILLARFADYDKILRCYFKHAVLCLIVIFAASFLHLTESEVKTFTYGSGMAFGTVHPNVLAAYLLSGSLLGVYLYFKEKTAISVVFLTAMSCLAWIITASRTSALLFLAFAVLLVAVKVMKMTDTQWLLCFMKVLVVLVVAASFFVALTDGIPVGSLDKNFSMRFIQAELIYEEYGLHLFGSNIQFINSEGVTRYILDNAYLRLFLYYGIVCGTLFVVWNTKMAAQLVKRKDYIFLSVFIIMILLGLSEKFTFWIQVNFCLLGINANHGGTAAEKRETAS